MDRAFTGIYDPEDESDRIIGQVLLPSGNDSAHLNYLLLTENAAPHGLVYLLEGLIYRAGQWGAKQVVAEIDINSEHFPLFRQAGFSVLMKQRVFCCQKTSKEVLPIRKAWRIWTHEDIHAMRRLYLSVVPALIQPVEPLTRRETLGLVYVNKEGQLQAYADLVYGPAGAWVLPIVHPQVDVPVSDLLQSMLANLPEVNSRPIYVTARSYQPWVEEAMQQISAEAGPDQACMVRYLTLRQRAEAEFSLSSVENGKPEPTFPVTSIKTNQPE